MRRLTLSLIFLLACVNEDDADLPAAFDVPCAEVHCTTIECPDDPCGYCTCRWEPANPVRCLGDGAAMCATQEATLASGMMGDD